MDEIKIDQIKKKDFDKARRFAIDGMHLSWYTTNKLELYVYSKYFWYLEISKATKILGAYMNNTLVGVLLADMNNEPKVFKSWWYKFWINLISFFINLGYQNASDVYNDANKEMLENFKNDNNPDGEINFFAVEPNIKGKGIGTLLLNEFAKQEKNKLVYLFTDSGSTYQFYSRRDFKKETERDIKLNINKKEVPLTCFIFSKEL